MSGTWGMSQRQVLERLLMERQPEEAINHGAASTAADTDDALPPETAEGDAIRPAETPPKTVTGEVLLLRRHIADLEHAHTLERDENRRLEASVTALLKRAIAAERALAEREVTARTVTSTRAARPRARAEPRKMERHIAPIKYTGTVIPELMIIILLYFILSLRRMSK
jgi:hypothetical protein